MTRLDGRAVVITGSGSGLGRAYALAVAAAGAHVVVNDVAADAAGATVAAIAAAGGEAIAVTGSVASWTVAEQLTATCVDAFGRIDGFVANAAIMRTALPWEESEDDLRTIAEVNVLGVQFGVRHALAAMVAAGRGGSIVTIVSGAQYGIPGMSAYGASKGAVTAMTANWALAGRDYGIRVNALSPLALTDMSRADVRPELPEFPDPTMIAPAVVALLCDASDGVTGCVIRFDGRRLGVYRTALSALGEREDWTVDAIADRLQAALAGAG